MSTMIDEQDEAKRRVRLGALMIHAPASKEALARVHKANPMKMRGNAWDVAEAIAYLASPAARFINGDLMIIDGGQAQWGVVWPAGMPEYFSEDGAA